MARNDQLEIVPFTPHHQSEVRALILAGLAERWETMDESLNRDIGELARLLRVLSGMYDQAARAAASL